MNIYIFVDDVKYQLFIIIMKQQYMNFVYIKEKKQQKTKQKKPLTINEMKENNL